MEPTTFMLTLFVSSQGCHDDSGEVEDNGEGRRGSHRPASVLSTKILTVGYTTKRAEHTHILTARGNIVAHNRPKAREACWPKTAHSINSLVKRFCILSKK